MSKLEGHWSSLVAAFFVLSMIILLMTGKFVPVDDYVGINTKIFLYPLIIILFTIVVAKLISQLLRKYFEGVNHHLQLVDKTRHAVIVQTSKLVIYLVGIGVAGSFIPALRSISVSLFASAGVLAIVIGLATQKTLGNVFSGLMIAVYRPYRIGDKIKFANEYGTVEDITLRHTVINTWDNRRIVVPNAKMDDEIINNYTIGDITILGTVDIGISYDSDIDLARKIMREEALAHPSFLDKRTEIDMLSAEDAVKVRVLECGDFSIKMRLFYWAQDQATNFRMKCDLTESIKKRFDLEGVEIPFPYRTLVEKRRLPKPKKLAKAKKPKKSKAK